MPLIGRWQQWLGPRFSGAQSKIVALDELAATGMSFTGVSQLFVRWFLDAAPAESCVLTVNHHTGPRFRFEGIRGESGAEVSQRKEAGESETVSFSRTRRGEAICAVPISTGRHIESIRHQSECFGTVELTAAKESEFTDGDRRGFNALARQLGFWLSHLARMEQATTLAVRDELTGLYNRRFLRQSLERALADAHTNRRPLSLLLLDIDHFKRFNDTFGHATGDRVLKLFGDLMRSLFRAEDVVSRYGGEEFAVLLCDRRGGNPANHPREVGQFAERLRREAEKLKLADGNGSVLERITVSGGIASYPWDAAAPDDLLSRADEALYRAKRNGRNRIYFAEQPSANTAG